VDLTEVLNAKTTEDVDNAIKKANGGQKPEEKKEPKRLAMLDEVRGLCVMAMVCYHAFFILASQFDVAWGQTLYDFFRPAQPVFAAMFILIAGICSRLSRDVRKRGLLLSVIALLINFLTLLVLPGMGFPDVRVLFGVLHLLAVSTLLFALFQKILDKIPALLGVILCLILFLLFAPVGQGYLGMFGFHADLPPALYQTNALFFLGFHKPDFVSFDYFPLLPYFFLFLFGSFMGKYAKDEKFPDFCYTKHSAFFGLLGRRALPIYLLHVPVFYGLFYFLRLVAAIGA